MLTRKQLILDRFDLRKVVDDYSRRLSEAIIRGDNLERQLRDADRYTVRIGCEVGLKDPMYYMQVCVHPMEFRHAVSGCNVNLRAAQIGEETGRKVAQALLDFVEGRLK